MTLHSAIKATSVLVLVALAATSASASGYDDPQTYGNADGYNPYGGLMFADCGIRAETTVDFCGDKELVEIKKIVKQAPTIGKNSVSFHFWDDTNKMYGYGAINKTSKKVFVFPYAVRATSAPNKNVKMSIVGKTKLCTEGSNTTLLGDEDLKTLTDKSSSTRYCSTFSDSKGFSSVKLEKIK